MVNVVSAPPPSHSRCGLDRGSSGRARYRLGRRGSHARARRGLSDFDFSLARVDDDYWRDTRSVIRPDCTRSPGAAEVDDGRARQRSRSIKALWTRLEDTHLQITEWRGTSAFVFAPTGPGAADYIQIALGREIEWRAGPIVNPDHRPWGEEDLLDPSWPRQSLSETDRPPAGLPPARPRRRRIRPYPRFLDRCSRVERDKREAKRPQMERRVIREAGPKGTRETPFLEAIPTRSTTCRGRCASFKTGKDRVPVPIASLNIGRSMFVITPTRANAKSVSSPGR